MNQDERRRLVAQALEADPDASQREIARALGCSQATIMRDCAWLKGESAAIHIVGEDDSPPKVAAEPPEPPEPSRGDALVARIRAEMAETGLIATSSEEEALTVVRDMADRIELLQGMIAQDGERRVHQGRIYAHPFISECRQLESALARIVSGIQTTETPAKNPVKQRAANSRWRSHQMKQAALQAGDPGA